MSPRARLIAVASAIAALFAGGAVVAVLAAFDGEPPVDGEFTLDQPGIYAEPIATSPVQGVALPDAELTDASGATRRVAEFVGRPLVINLWYSTCAPCARELRDFAAVSTEHAGHVQFLGIDPLDDIDTMTAFAEARGVDYALLRDPEQQFISQLGTVAYPTTLLVAPDGRIVFQTNEISADELRAAIEEYF
jgi:peroxiredoxin